MTCSDMHVYLFAFLDNELESALSIELQQHLDRCAACAREAEIERTIQKRLHATLAPEGASASELEATFAAGSLEDRAVGEGRAEGLTRPKARRPKATRPKSTRRAWLSRRRPAVLAAMVPLTLAGIWFTWSHDSISARPRIVELAVADFRHFEDEGKPLQIASTDRQEVAAWLREKTSIDMALPNALESHWQLTGGRKCTLDGQRAAFAVYEFDGDLASVVALPLPLSALRGLQPLETAERMLWTHQDGACTVVAARHDELVYVAVSRLPVDRLVPLLPGADR